MKFIDELKRSALSAEFVERWLKRLVILLLFGMIFHRISSVESLTDKLLENQHEMLVNEKTIVQIVVKHLTDHAP